MSFDLRRERVALRNRLAGQAARTDSRECFAHEIDAGCPRLVHGLADTRQTEQVVNAGQRTEGFFAVHATIVGRANRPPEPLR